MYPIEYRVTVDRRAEWAALMPEWERAATRDKYVLQSARVGEPLTRVDDRCTLCNERRT